MNSIVEQDKQQAEQALTFGVDLGGTKTEIIALKAGTELFRERVATVKGSYADTIKTIAGLVRAAHSALNLEASVPVPFGIAIPGAVSATTHVIKNANSYWLNGHDLQGDLSEALQQPRNSIFLENDANCFALSEATDGAGEQGKVVWGLILGTGTGSGVVHNKELIRGRNLLTGEWGHNSMPWLTPEEIQMWVPVQCFCGKQYCLETFVSGTGLERDYAIRSGAFKTEDKVFAVNGKEIMQRRASGEELAQISFKAYVNRLARAIANYANFLDPDVIVFGGGMSNVDELYELLPQAIQPYIFGGEFSTPIVKAKYGDSSGGRGAAWLPLMSKD